VHALRAERFASMQFHAESVLTRHGPRIIGSFLAGLVRDTAPASRRTPVSLAVAAADGVPSKDR
jgi:phenazine biosynthesis protein phzE